MVFLSGFRWALLITVIDAIFTALAIFSAHISPNGYEQFWFNLHRVWYFVHLPAADLAAGLLPNFIASEMDETPVELHFLYIFVCVLQTAIFGFVLGVLVGLLQKTNKSRQQNSSEK